MELLKLYNIEPIYLLDNKDYTIEYNIDDYYDLFVENLPDIINVQKTKGNIPSKLEKKNINFEKLLNKTNYQELPNIKYTTNNHKIANILLLNNYNNFELNFKLDKIYKYEYDKSAGYNKYYFDNYYFDNYDYKLEISSVNHDNYKFNYECTINYGTLNRNGTLSMTGVNNFGKKFHQNYNIKYKYELIIDKNKIIKKYILYKSNYINSDFLNLLNFYYTCYKLKDQNKTKIDSIIKIKGVLKKNEINKLINNIKSNITRIPESNNQDKHNLIKKVKNNIKKIKNKKKIMKVLRINNNKNKK